MDGFSFVGGLAFRGFVFGLIGFAGFVQVNRLEQKLEAKGVLDSGKKDE